MLFGDNMIEDFKYEKRPNYPHMSVADKAIWERFIDQYPDQFDSVQYDYHVGDAPPFNTLMDDGEDLNQDKLYRKRIDVVAHVSGAVYIIEIKPAATIATTGQVEGYKMLYERDEEIRGPVNMMILTDELTPNMEWLCKKKGITLVVV